MPFESVNSIAPVINWMLIIVIENPMQLTIVSTVPFISADAFWATSVDKRGESAITTIPQKIRKPINKLSNSLVNINGEIMQHPHDKSNAINAVRLVPAFSAI